MVKLGQKGMLLVIWFLLVALVGATVAGPFEDGLKA
jgi:hypothetical protein